MQDPSDVQVPSDSNKQPNDNDLQELHQKSGSLGLQSVLGNSEENSEELDTAITLVERGNELRLPTLMRERAEAFKNMSPEVLKRVFSQKTFEDSQRELRRSKKHTEKLRDRQAGAKALAKVAALKGKSQDPDSNEQAAEHSANQRTVVGMLLSQKTVEGYKAVKERLALSHRHVKRMRNEQEQFKELFEKGKLTEIIRRRHPYPINDIQLSGEPAADYFELEFSKIFEETLKAHLEVIKEKKKEAEKLFTSQPKKFRDNLDRYTNLMENYKNLNLLNEKFAELSTSKNEEKTLVKRVHNAAWFLSQYLEKFLVENPSWRDPHFDSEVRYAMNEYCHILSDMIYCIRVSEAKYIVYQQAIDEMEKNERFASQQKVDNDDSTATKLSSEAKEEVTEEATKTSISFPPCAHFIKSPLDLMKRSSEEQTTVLTYQYKGDEGKEGTIYQYTEDGKPLHSILQTLRSNSKPDKETDTSSNESTNAVLLPPPVFKPIVAAKTDIDIDSSSSRFVFSRPVKTRGRSRSHLALQKPPPLKVPPKLYKAPDIKLPTLPTSTSAQITLQKKTDVSGGAYIIAQSLKAESESQPVAQLGKPQNKEQLRYSQAELLKLVSRLLQKPPSPPAPPQSKVQSQENNPRDNEEVSNVAWVKGARI